MKRQDAPQPESGPEPLGAITARAAIRQRCNHLASLQIRGNLGTTLAEIILAYSPKDILHMKRNFSTRVQDMDSGYRDRLTAKIAEHLSGTWQRVRLLHQQGAFARMTGVVPKEAASYWAMAANSCDQAATADGARLRFLKYLLAGFCMFVLQEPAHPVGTPFPGGDTVEFVDGVYYCPVREKQGDVDAALCPFCPARQTPAVGYLKPPTGKSEHRKQEFIENTYAHHHFNG